MKVSEIRDMKTEELHSELDRLRRHVFDLRSQAVTDACKANGGFYLGSIGGPAARLGKECITSVKVLEYPELGMEAVFMITVKDFPAFIIVDDKGNDFFESLLR